MRHGVYQVCDGFQTPALRVVRVVGLRRGMTPDPDSWRAVLIDATRSLNEERSFFSSVCRLDRRGGGEGEGEDEGEHDREVTGLGRACCRRPNDCLCICGPKLLERRCSGSYRRLRGRAVVSLGRLLAGVKCTEQLDAAGYTGNGNWEIDFFYCHRGCAGCSIDRLIDHASTACLFVRPPCTTVDDFTTSARPNRATGGPSEESSEQG